MRRVPKFWGLHARPGKKLAAFLALLPFVLMIGMYCYVSTERHAKNPNDKLVPVPSKMIDAAKLAISKVNKRTKKIEHQIMDDTIASMRRIGVSLACAALFGLLIGLNVGLFRGFETLFSPSITFISIIPPLAIMPILLIAFGKDEVGKMALIFLGTCPLIVRDIFNAVKKVPVEQVTKALTLGADQWDVTYRVVLPQIMPKLIETVRISMGPAWLFLIASESLAAKVGLGYRIFLVRRYMDMSTIIPYVLWIVLIGFTVDRILCYILRNKYRWYSSES